MTYVQNISYWMFDYRMKMSWNSWWAETFATSVLTLKTLEYFYKIETKGFFQFDKWFSQLFPIHLNTYVMGLRPLYIFNSYIFNSKDGPRAERVNIWHVSTTL